LSLTALTFVHSTASYHNFTHAHFLDLNRKSTARGSATGPTSRLSCNRSKHKSQCLSHGNVILDGTLGLLASSRPSTTIPCLHACRTSTHCPRSRTGENSTQPFPYRETMVYFNHRLSRRPARMYPCLRTLRTSIKADQDHSWNIDIV